MKLSRFGAAEPFTKADFLRVLNEIQVEAHRVVFGMTWYAIERPGAILKLNVSNVYSDPQRKTPHSTIVIPGDIRKDGRTREIEAHRELAALLRSHKPPADGWLFPSTRDPSRSISYQVYYEGVMRAIERVGLVGYSPYSTRHGALTLLSEKGVSTRQMQAASGHAKLENLQRYARVSPAKRAQVIALL